MRLLYAGPSRRRGLAFIAGVTLDLLGIWVLEQEMIEQKLRSGTVYTRGLAQLMYQGSLPCCCSMCSVVIVLATLTPANVLLIVGHVMVCDMIVSVAW